MFSKKNQRRCLPPQKYSKVKIPHHKKKLSKNRFPESKNNIIHFFPSQKMLNWGVICPLWPLASGQGKVDKGVQHTVGSFWACLGQFLPILRP